LKDKKDTKRGAYESKKKKKIGGILAPGWVKWFFLSSVDSLVKAFWGKGEKL